MTKNHRAKHITQHNTLNISVQCGIADRQPVEETELPAFLLHLRTHHSGGKVINYFSTFRSSLQNVRLKELKWSTFVKVVTKMKVIPFYGLRCRLCQLYGEYVTCI